MYRVITFQSAAVVDLLFKNKEYFADKTLLREGSLCNEDIEVCGGNIPIWVFQHPAFCLDKVGPHQFCNMLQTFKEEMSIPTLVGLYLIEIHLDEQPVKGKAHNDSSCACVIPSIKLQDVAAIYKVTKGEDFYFNNLELCQLFTDNALFSESISFTKEMYKSDKLPTLSLIRFSNASEYYVYDKVIYAYTCHLVGSKCLDLTITEIVEQLPKRILTLDELYMEINRFLFRRLIDKNDDVNIDSIKEYSDTLKQYAEKFKIKGRAALQNEVKRLCILYNTTDIGALVKYIKADLL